MKLDNDLVTGPYGVTMDDLTTWVQVRVATSETFLEATSVLRGRPTAKLCADWWNHPEIVSRFAALHQEWVSAIEFANLSAWWLHHWDPQTEKIIRLGRECGADGCTFLKRTQSPVNAPPAEAHS